jgi:hypothetical protein
LLINLLVLPACVIAESADDYFNYGAQDYIFGEKDKAKTQILNGLRVYPSDPKLNGVIRLLRRPEQKPPPQQKPSKSDEKKDQDKQKQDKQKQEQQAKAEKPSDKRDKEPEKAEEMAQQTMSPQEARQLLDSQQENEKVLIFAPSNQPITSVTGKIKDW